MSGLPPPEADGVIAVQGARRMEEPLTRMEEPLTQDQASIVHNQRVAGTAMEHVGDASHVVCSVTDVFHSRRDFFHSRQQRLPLGAGGLCVTPPSHAPRLTSAQPYCLDRFGPIGPRFGYKRRTTRSKAARRPSRSRRPSSPAPPATGRAACSSRLGLRARREPPRPRPWALPPGGAAWALPHR